jgi:hypothetical protein
MKPLQIKAALTKHTLLRRMIAATALLGLTLGIHSIVGTAHAQSGPLCTRFAEGAAGQDGWGACPTAPNIVVTTTNVGSSEGASDYHLHLRDTAGASAACSTDPKYQGNWVEKMGGCGQFCFDFKLFKAGTPPASVHPSFSIYDAAGNRAVFVANVILTAADPWEKNICAPVKLIQPGENLPSGPSGSWQILPTGNAYSPNWNSIIQNVAMMQLPVDFTADPSEEVGYDNLCMSPKPCDPPPPPPPPPPPVIKGCLEDTKVAVKCNPNGTYTVTLNGSSFSGTVITMTSQTAGVTVTPPQQLWSATTTWTVTGATAGQTVVLTANATKVGGGKEDGTDLCCSGEITIVMPDCPKQEVGQVVVEKKVKNDTNASNATINALVFPIGLTCGPPSTLNTSFNLNNGGSHTENNVPYGSLCTVTESTSTLPAVPKDVCDKGSTAVWATPVIVPPSATVSAPVTAFTVVNELSCKKIGDVGSLVVEKKVKNNTSASNATINALVFPIGVTCGPPSNLNVTFGLSNAGSHTENNIPYGSVCTVTESVSTLPAVPKDVCPRGSTAAWATPVIVPPSATINAPLTAFTVVNELTCKKIGEVGTLIVKKEVKYDGPIALRSQTYPVTVTCGSTVTNLNLVPGVPQTVSNIPLNTSCSIVEGTVTTPPNVCPRGTTPVWSTAYVPPSPLIINGTVTETVRNTLSCRKAEVCLPPLVMGPAGQCICPPGTIQSGKECVKPHTCPPPLVMGPADQCICPQGTVLVGKECVKPHTCPSPLVIGPADQCICPQGTVLVGKECVKPHTCQPPLVMGPADQCVCPKGTVQQGRRCVPPIECRSPLIPNATGTDCVCRPGLVQKGRRCVEPVVCKPPATLNRRGECQCPPDMVARGNSCVERERPPTVTPGIPPRGRDNEPPRGGGRDNEPPRGGGRDTDPPRGGQGPTDLPGRR